MSRDKGEAVQRGEFVVHEWTLAELERADKGATLAELLADRAERALLYDSPTTPLASDLLARLPQSTPATPDQRRAALDEIRALLADHLPTLADRKEITP
jgi:hypothetical protein